MYKSGVIIDVLYVQNNAGHRTVGSSCEDSSVHVKF